MNALVHQLGRRARKGKGLFAYLSTLRAIRHQRLRLELLDDHMLADIGLTREEALREADRLPWDAPRHWQE